MPRRLPFLGRDVEMQALVNFWADSCYADGLRVLLLAGEAGIGKSRLIEEASTTISGLGGIVIHCKLVPESTDTIRSLVADAIRSTTPVALMVRNVPTTNADYVAIALRRISRLRPVLLVFEDVHLLQDDGSRQLYGLLHSVSEEPISVLCATRIADIEIRPALMEFLVEEIRLSGLERSDVAQIWRIVFGADPQEDIIAALRSGTCGNPLALRSVLRGLVVGGFSPAIESLQFELRRVIALVADGLVAHLTDDELRLAQKLSHLGEVFARETARDTCSDFDVHVETLMEKGIVAVTTRRMRPLHGTVDTFCNDDYPPSRFALFSFTHSLIHQHLSSAPVVNAGELVSALARDLPFYTLHIASVLQRLDSKLCAAKQDVVRCVDRLVEIQLALGRPADDIRQQHVGRTAASLVARAEADGIIQKNELEYVLLYYSIFIGRPSDLYYNEVYRARLARLLEITSCPGLTDLGAYRLAALVWEYFRTNFTSINDDKRIRCDIEALLEQSPQLRFTTPWVLYLSFTAYLSKENYDSAEVNLRWVEDQLEQIKRSEHATSHFRRFAVRRITPWLIDLFADADEVKTRLKSVEELIATSTPNDNGLKGLYEARFRLLAGQGHFDRAVDAFETYANLVRSRGDVTQPVYTMTLLVMRQAFACDLHALETQIRELYSSVPIERQAELRRQTWFLPFFVGVLLGSVEWQRTVAELAPENRYEAMAELQLLASTVAPAWPVDRIVHGPSTCWSRVLTDFVAQRDPQLIDDAVAAAKKDLLKPMCTWEDIGGRYAIFALIRAARLTDDVRGFADALETTASSSLIDTLEWMAGHEHVVFLGAAIGMHADLLTPDEIKAWHGRVSVIRAVREARAVAADDSRTQVSMIGTIACSDSTGKLRPVRGSAQRAMLAMLVADHMLSVRLTFDEMAILIAKDETDPSRARKALNLAVHRLRETLGAHCIVTDERVPKLDVTRVKVDLLDANAMIAESRKAVHDGALLRAVPAITRAVEIAGGEVPFPGLYDEFFEGSRCDFEVRLRDAIIEVSSALLRDGDALRAEEVLRMGFDTMPNDEEMSELLRALLVVLDRTAEAESVKMRTTAANVN